MGWARTIRDMKTFGFIELNDGSCFKNLQVVMDANVLSNYKEIAGQNVGAALIVTGQVVLTPEAKQPLEVKAASIAVDGPAPPPDPPAPPHLPLYHPINLWTLCPRRATSGASDPGEPPQDPLAQVSHLRGFSPR